MFLADVIFPAFTAPYFAWFFFPLAAGSAILAEIVVFRFRYRFLLSWGEAVKFTLEANLASWCFGVILSFILPSGLVPRIIRNGGKSFTTLTQGPYFDRLMLCGFILAFLLSVLIEYFVWKLLLKPNSPAYLAGICVMANLASYALLVGIAYSYIQLGWW